MQKGQRLAILLHNENLQKSLPEKALCLLLGLKLEPLVSAHKPTKKAIHTGVA
jgi:hypothetical protein